MILQAGIKKIHYLRNYHNDPYAMSLLKRMHIEVQHVKFTDEEIAAISMEKVLNQD